MNWKGKKLQTIGDFMKYGIDKCDSKEEAKEFMMQYVMENHHARTNIGYISGYYARIDQERIFDWFDVVHPISGTEKLDHDKLFQIGLAIGKRAAMETN